MISDALEQFVQENDITNMQKQYINSRLETGETEYSGASDMLSLNELSYYFTEENYFEKSYYMSVPSVGFGNTAVSFANSITEKADLKLNSKVVGIDYEDEENVFISYEEDENGITKEVRAKTALVTVSLGVLKAGSIAFSPTLPDWKQDAISGMGFGLLNKIVLYWNNSADNVWPEDTYWLELITPEDESSGVWTTWMNASELKGVPCLVGWIGGDEAVVMETQTDEEILERVMTNLRSMFPVIKQPDEVMITRWGELFNS